MPFLAITRHKYVTVLTFLLRSLCSFVTDAFVFVAPRISASDKDKTYQHNL